MSWSEQKHLRQSHLRQWRKRQHARLFFAIGVLLAVYTALTLLPALWWSDLARTDALLLTLWLVWAQVVALRAVWRTLRPLWRRAE